MSLEHHYLWFYGTSSQQATGLSISGSNFPIVLRVVSVLGVAQSCATPEELRGIIRCTRISQHASMSVGLVLPR